MKTINIRICNIPCKVKINSFYNQEGNFSRNSPSDLDFYGFTELDFTILDRKGYPAPWLERKLEKDTKEQESLERRIVSLILKHKNFIY